MPLGRCWPVLFWAALLALACGSPSAGTAPAAPDGRARPSADPAASAAAGGEAALPSTAAASGRRASSSASAEPGSVASLPDASPLLASDSAPKGIAPLTTAERTELAGPCKPLSAAVSAAAPRANTRLDALARAEQVLGSPPKLAGVDVPRCSELLLRELRAYRTSLIEAEAITNLKIIMVGMARAYDGDPKILCPGAPATPADLQRLGTGRYQSSPADWQAEGWRCVRFELGAPQRFQYELRVDRATQSFEIVARGFPVSPDQAEELFLQGKVARGAIQPSSAVYRRR